MKSAEFTLELTERVELLLLAVLAHVVVLWPFHCTFAPNTGEHVLRNVTRTTLLQDSQCLTLRFLDVPICMDYETQ